MITDAHPVMSMDRLREGAGGIIFSYQGHSEVLHRLRELGLVKGTRVTVKRFAPLQDPMELEVRGYRLSVRKEDAKNLMVQICP